MKTRRSYLRKTVVLTLMMFAIMTVMITRMAYVQLVKADELSEAVVTKSIRTYVEPASRGTITDRNGTVLAYDVPCYMLEFDYYEWDRKNQNDVILRLCGILADRDASWNDNLPLSEEPPYSYTYASRESGAGKKLMKFMDERKWDREIPASRFFALMCDRYGISEELTSHEKRMIIGVRYYMEDCQFSSYNSPITIATDVDIDVIAMISAESAFLPGVGVRASSVRVYGSEGLLSHVLGRVALISSEEYKQKKDQGYGLTDMIGKDGLEKGLESYLRGVDGVRAVEVDRSTGELLEGYMLEDPDPGDLCVLTVDMELQEVTERALAETLQSLNDARDEKDPVEGGAAVVISVKTGEILAMASYPTYDLSTYVRDLAEKSSDPLRPYYNRATMGLYSPGSTFKMATALAALEEGVITPKTTIKDEGVYMFYAPTYTPGCWIWNDYHATHGTINVSDAIKYSCNYFFYETGRLLGIERLNKYAEMLGLGQKTGIELTDEKAGNLAGPESREKNGGAKWKPSETIQAAIGQTEQQFTPVQIASYIATLVSGGKRYQPHLLLSRTDGSDGTVFDTPLDLTDYEFSKSSIDAIKKGMKGVVTEDGTASKYFRDFPIEVGGKTGSAQTQTGRSANGVFVSFAPYDDPEIAVCVVGEHAGSGGSVAPVCIAIYDKYFGLGLSETDETGEPAATAAAAE